MTGSLPRVAVVVLNYNGRHHLGDFFDSVDSLEYPPDRLEVILVDNGSSDGSVDFVRQLDRVRLLENESNVGFSAGSNQGAAASAEVDIVCFVNNDMRLAPAFLRELVSPIERGEAVATTAKILSWDGSQIDSAGGGMNFHGIGIQRGMGEKPGVLHDVAAPTLFACGGAMAIQRDVFHDEGGFDEDFFAYYEDVDLGWRLWLMGHVVQYVPTAVCFHRHAGTSSRFPSEAIRLLQVRNPVLTCFKNYDEENLRRVLPAAFALAMRRMHLVSGVGSEGSFRIEQASVRSSGWLTALNQWLRSRARDRVPVRREAVADLLGLNDLFENWDHWVEARRRVQLRRRRTDAEILALFDDPFWCIEQDPSYSALHDGVLELFDIRKMFSDP